jgi:hypothetical protein
MPPAILSTAGTWPRFDADGAAGPADGNLERRTGTVPVAR